MTFKNFKSEAVKELTSVGNDNASSEIDNIIIHRTGFSKSELLLNRSKEIAPDTLALLKKDVERRKNKEPLQYIIGEWEFYGLRMFCGEGVLIPRCETELLAQIVIENIPQNGIFLDLCTGSGCISCAVLNNCKNVSGIGVDISEKALYYADKNIAYHGLSDRFNIVSADLSQYVPDKKFDVIVSNPPYIKSADLNILQKELLFEPVIALDGGENGLTYYSTIVKRYKRFLKDDGIFAFEVGYDTGQEVALLLENSGMEAEICNDNAGITRVVIGKKII